VQVLLHLSEDGILGGKIASAVVSGAADKGVFAYIKHFALNDQAERCVFIAGPYQP